MQMPAVAGAQLGRKRKGAFGPQITTEASTEHILFPRELMGEKHEVDGLVSLQDL